MSKSDLPTTTRPEPREKQRTVSPQPSTSKQLNKRTLPADDESDYSNDIELIDPPPNPPPNKARPQRKEGKVKALESRPNGKVPDSLSNTTPESQVKGKAPGSRAKDGQVKPKPVKVVKKHSLNPSIDDASNHDEDQEHQKPPLNPIDRKLDRVILIKRSVGESARQALATAGGALPSSQHTLRDELARLKDEVKAKAALVKERERRIVELEQNVKDVRIELDAEIARRSFSHDNHPPTLITPGPISTLNMPQPSFI
ncbi:hypothetical protein K503DRAFT_797786 [Rhizopogon vinicolor AM-OR11-026]|uniref:Uncharacterized protein n=1 Tax=Rhizopogon vinicolor AM-OR11-026 TaxID=1314800 RepID=A0A1B7NA72_9AGAM|nr:hypothetical protein K503DRAFT_797786 [Rhizopogon vinicolor AM-OR11-026]